MIGDIILILAFIIAVIGLVLMMIITSIVILENLANRAYRMDMNYRGRGKLERSEI